MPLQNTSAWEKLINALYKGGVNAVTKHPVATVAAGGGLAALGANMRKGDRKEEELMELYTGHSDKYGEALLTLNEYRLMVKEASHHVKEAEGRPDPYADAREAREAARAGREAQRHNMEMGRAGSESDRMGLERRELELKNQSMERELGAPQPGSMRSFVNDMKGGFGTAIGASAARELVSGVIGGGVAAYKGLEDTLINKGKREAILKQILASDPIIMRHEQENPGEVARLYATMIRFAPTLSTDPHAALAFLRNAIMMGGAIDYRTIQGLADAETSVKKALTIGGGGWRSKV